VSSFLISAGDASGEMHAAGLVRALRRRAPQSRFAGLGGSEMQRAGVELLAPQRALSVCGLFEVLGSLRRIRSAWRRMNRALEARPDLLVLVDSPDFNIPLARRARRLGLPVLYYIGPQVWAWRRGRVRKIARRVDRLAVIFPFEVDFYRGAGLPVEFVGHPLVERLADFARDWPRARARNALQLAPERPLLALLPGSRRNELQRMLPLQLEVARILHARLPSLHFAVALAQSIPREAAAPLLARAGAGLPLSVHEGRTWQVLRAADAALAKPGTITMELALLGTPFAVALRVHPLSALIGRRLIEVPSFTMPNLIAGAPIAPEFMQEQAQPARIAEALWELLSGPARQQQCEALDSVRRTLGAGGSAGRVAEIALEMVRGASGA